MKSTLLILLTLSLGSFLACKSQVYTAENYPEPHIRFGSGGGFTGLITTHYLMPNGELYQGSSTDTTLTALTRARQNEVETLFDFVSTIGPENLVYNKPANYYQFVEFHLGDEVVNCVFAPNDPDLPPTLQQIYSRLNQFVTPTR